MRIVAGGCAARSGALRLDAGAGGGPRIGPAVGVTPRFGIRVADVCGNGRARVERASRANGLPRARCPRGSLRVAACGEGLACKRALFEAPERHARTDALRTGAGVALGAAVARRFSPDARICARGYEQRAREHHETHGPGKEASHGCGTEHALCRAPKPIASRHTLDGLGFVLGTHCDRSALCQAPRGSAGTQPRATCGPSSCRPLRLRLRAGLPSLHQRSPPRAPWRRPYPWPLRPPAPGYCRARMPHRGAPQ